jgi:aminopeptidase N
MGAMENWGLVTYRTTAVLFEEGKSDSRYKNRIAYVVAHGTWKPASNLVPDITNDLLELAHQWFGNLVTMDWWNELWLNEGFATWVGWLAVDHFYPGKALEAVDRSYFNLAYIHMQNGMSGLNLLYATPEVILNAKVDNCVG